MFFNNAEKRVFVFHSGKLLGTIDTAVKSLTFYMAGCSGMRFYITMPIPILYEERR
jgi:hypothetical protein